ncbi:MAG: DUF4173 domain-containing protein, partial [Chloroflexota bacterium]|nr:DUF4173 domain-containing protein [Chloroflexota bacterium]
MEAHRPAAVLTVALAIGLLGQHLFFDVPLGVNLVAMVAVLLLAVWRLRPSGAHLGLRDAWLPVAALVLAAFVAVRADPALVFLDLVGTMILTGAAATAVAGHAVMLRPASGIGTLAGVFVANATAAAAPLIARVNRERGRFAGVPVRRAVPFLRGVAIALPIMLVFVALFATADAVFARRMTDLFDVSFDLGELMGRAAWLVGIGWITAGILAFAARAARVAEPDDVASAATQRPDNDDWRLGTTEAVVVLVALDAVFALFISVQVEYLFGGRDTLATYGFTYSDYARRGFFELAAAAALAGGLLIGLESIVRTRPAVYVAAAAVLCALTGLVLASAAQRLSLYQQAYGWTELRFYVLAAIAWLGICVVLSIAAVLANRSHWL